MWGKSSIGLKFLKMLDFWWKFLKFLKISKNNRKLYFFVRFCSTSYPSGNQVDGSPLVAVRKQWLSQPDLGPHKMMRHHPKMIELSRFWIITLRKCTGNSAERTIKMKVELIKHANANATTWSIGFQIFENFRKIKKFVIFSESFTFILFFYHFQNFVFLTRHSKRSSCGNWVDGLPHIVHTETVAKPGRLGRQGPWKMVRHHLKMIKLPRFCWITRRKVQRKGCRAYVEDSYGANKI